MSSKMKLVMVPKGVVVPTVAKGANGQKRKKKRAGGKVTSGSASMGMSVGIASTAILDRNTILKRVGEPFMSQYGMAQRVSGRQYLTTVTTAADTTSLFAGGGIGGASIIQLSPDILGGRLALEARTYQRFLFRKIRLIYTPRVATTQVGEFVIAYASDPEQVTFAAQTFATAQNVQDSVVCSFHNGGKQLIIDFPIPQGAHNSYFTELDGTVSSGLRETCQGIFFGYPDGNLGVLTMGNLAIEYMVDFFCPTADYGFTLTSRLKSFEEKQYLDQALRNFRLTNTVNSSSSSSSFASKNGFEMVSRDCVTPQIPFRK